jgi:hypothetical protein
MPTAASLLAAHISTWAAHPTTFASLDALLGGGIGGGEVVEFFGAAGSGKTLIALAAAARAALDGGAALVVVSGTEPAARALHALLGAGARARARAALARGAPLAEALPRAAAAAAAAAAAGAECGGGAAVDAALRADADGAAAAGGAAVEAALRADVEGAAAAEAAAAGADVRVARAADWESLRALLGAVEAALAAAPRDGWASRLRVVALDGLSSIVYPILSGAARGFAGHAALTAAGAALHAIARAAGAAVLVTNAATADRDDRERDRERGDAGPQKPALGPTWAIVPDASVYVARSLAVRAGGAIVDVVACAVIKAAAPPAAEGAAPRPRVSVDVVADVLAGGGA